VKFSATTERPSHSLMSPRVSVFGRSVSAYRVFGLAGIASAAALGMFLASERKLPLGVVAAILAASIVTFFVLIIARQALTGEERITYYHHEMGVLIVVAVLLRILGEPILPYLDLAILGVGIFLALGRVGCFRVGCCHGRPNRFGLRYEREHADTGFRVEYVGVRLFPIQLVESTWAFCIVAAGSWMLLGGAPAGSALSFYVVTYAVGRFCFEFLRGDPDRLYLFGFSEAQWISLGLSWAVVAFAASGEIPFSALQWASAGGLSIAMVALAAKRTADRAESHRLLGAAHLRELAEAVSRARSPAGTIAGAHGVCVARTSAGLRISSGRIIRESGNLIHFTLSHAEHALTSKIAARLASVIGELLDVGDAPEVLEGASGVFHLLIRRPLEGGSFKIASKRHAAEPRSRCPYNGLTHREPVRERF